MLAVLPSPGSAHSLPVTHLQGKSNRSEKTAPKTESQQIEQADTGKGSVRREKAHSVSDVSEVLFGAK